MSRSVGVFKRAVIVSWIAPALGVPAAAIASPESSAVVSAAPVVAPDSTRIASLGEDLAHARWVRLTSAGRQVELEHPRVGAEGLGFSRAKGFPVPRPALVTSRGWNQAVPPPNPVSWSAIERIEVSEGRWGPFAPLGFGLGTWGGVVLGALAGWWVASATENSYAGVATFAGVTIGFAVLGTYSMGHSSEWTEVYPARTFHPQDPSATAAGAPAHHH